VTRLTVALTAILCACHGKVTTYQAEPASTSQGGAGAGGQADGGPGGVADAGPCVTVQCQMPDGEWIGCGCGEVCCDFGGIWDCAEPDSCKPFACEGDAMCWPWGVCVDGWCEGVDGGVE